jgi:hypothetical protein
MSRAGRRRLQLDDGPSDSFPYGLPLEIAAFEHHVGALDRCKLSIVTMLPDQKVGGPPDVEVRGSSTGAERLALIAVADIGSMTLARRG